MLRFGEPETKTRLFIEKILVNAIILILAAALPARDEVCGGIGRTTSEFPAIPGEYPHGAKCAVS